MGSIHCIFNELYIKDSKEPSLISATTVEAV